MIRQARRENIPLPRLLLVTGDGSEAEEEMMREAGVTARIIHPVTASGWYDAILKLFDKKISRPSGISQLVRITDTWRACLTGRKILLVEDNAINQELGHDLLAAVGIETTIVGDGAAALAALARESFDLVLMDIQMPVMDGYEATRRFRSTESGKRLPIIAMTAGVSREDREQSRQAGMDDHLVKPINPVELYQTIGRWCGIAEPESESLSPVAQPVEAAAVQGIDLDAALARFSGNQARLQEMLERFGHDHAGTVQTITRLLAENNWSEAAKQMHAVKGVAANLGLVDVAAAAKMLEGQCARKEPAARKDGLSRFEAAMAQAVMFITGLEPVAKPAASVPLSDQEWAEAVERLRTALRENDFHATTLFREIEPRLTGMSDLARDLRQAISRFHFEKALSLLDTIPRPQNSPKGGANGA